MTSATVTSRRTLVERAVSLAIILTCMGAGWYCYAPYLSERWAFSPWGDTVFLTGSLFCEMSRSLAAGKLPLLNWSTYEAIDYNTHVAGYYPFYIAAFFDFCSPEKTVQGQDIISVIHIGISFFATLVLCRVAGAGWAGSAVGALFSILALNMLALARFATIVAPAAWVPLSVAGLVLIFYRDKPLHGVFTLAFAMSAMLTAGPGTNMLAALVFMGLVFSVHTLLPAVLGRDWGELKHFSKLAVLAGVLVALAVAGSTFNLYMHMDEIIRWTRTGAVIGGAGAASWKEILAEKQGILNVMQLVAASSDKFAVGHFYIGPAAAMLGIAGALLSWQDRICRGFAYGALTVLALVFIVPGFLLVLWAFVPGISHVRHLSILATPLVLSVAVLSAFGVTRLLEGCSLSPVQRKVLWGMAAAVALGCAIGIWISPVKYYTAPVVYGLALTSIALVPLLFSLPTGPARAMGVLVLAGLTTVLMNGLIIKVPGTPAVMATPTWKAAEEALAFVSKDKATEGRIVIHSSITTDGLNFMRIGEMAAFRGIPTFQYYMSPRIVWRFESENIGYAKKLQDYSLLGGTHVLSSADLSEQLGMEAFASGNVRVYRLKAPRPIVSAVCNDDPALSELSSDNDVFPGRLPLVDLKLIGRVEALRDGHADCPSVLQPQEVARQPQTDSVRWTQPAGKSRLLLVNLPAYEAWKLTVGGRPVAVQALSDSQMVAFVPGDLSGAAILSYHPGGYFMRLMISALGWAIILAFGGYLLFQTRRDARVRSK